MTVFNRRNAVVGFVTLKAISRDIKRRRARPAPRSRLKIALFVTLAIVSVGIFAGVAAAFLKARRSGPQHLEGYAVADEAEGAAESAGAVEAEETLPEPEPTTSEPIPAA